MVQFAKSSDLFRDCNPRRRRRNLRFLVIDRMKFGVYCRVSQNPKNKCLVQPSIVTTFGLIRDDESSRRRECPLETPGMEPFSPCFDLKSCSRRRTDIGSPPLMLRPSARLTKWFPQAGSTRTDSENVGDLARKSWPKSHVESQKIWHPASAATLIKVPANGAATLEALAPLSAVSAAAWSRHNEYQPALESTSILSS
jgi:hypothetical protein